MPDHKLDELLRALLLDDHLAGFVIGHAEVGLHRAKTGVGDLPGLKRAALDDRLQAPPFLLF